MIILKKITSFVILAIFYSCLIKNEKDSKRVKVENFSISANDSNLVISLYKVDSSFLINYNIKSKRKNIIFALGKKEGICSKPIFSDDKLGIFFLIFNNSAKSNIYYIRTNSSKFKQVTFQNGRISEFSVVGDSIIFAKAAVYKNYSPIAVKGFHGQDIFLYQIKSKLYKQLTFTNYYALNSLSISNNDLYYKSDLNDSNTGLFKMSLSNLKISSQNPLNNPEVDNSLYFNPIFNSKLNQVVFSAPYSIYRMNQLSRQAYLIYRSKIGIVETLTGFHNKKDILFLNSGYNDKIIKLNCDTKNIEEILTY